VGADDLQKLVTGHRLHVPVGDDKAVFLGLDLLQCRLTARCLVNVLETDRFQKLTNDPNHGAVIVYDEDRHVVRAHNSQSPLPKSKIGNLTCRRQPAPAAPADKGDYAGILIAILLTAD